MENIYFSNILVCQVLRRMRWFSYSPSSSWMKHSWGFEFECLVQGLVKNVGSRTNYVVIFSFSFLIWKWKHYICMKVKVAQSCLTLCDPMVPLSLEFSRPEYWSGSLLQGIVSTQEPNPASLVSCIARQTPCHWCHLGIEYYMVP